MFEVAKYLRAKESRETSKGGMVNTLNYLFCESIYVQLVKLDRDFLVSKFLKRKPEHYPPAGMPNDLGVEWTKILHEAWCSDTTEDGNFHTKLLRFNLPILTFCCLKSMEKLSVWKTISC